MVGYLPIQVEQAYQDFHYKVGRKKMTRILRCSVEDIVSHNRTKSVLPHLADKLLVSYEGAPVVLAGEQERVAILVTDSLTVVAAHPVLAFLQILVAALLSLDVTMAAY